jgi:chromosomal replication initiator protein DnaA
MRLDARLRFENLVVGAGNRLAAAAARAVAESPGLLYNPLFVYGGGGLGKTHLLNAVGHLTETLHPDADIEYTTLDDFVEQLHAAVSAGQVEAFSRRYDRVDLLLLDDAQRLSGRFETQAELLRLFERMLAGDKQVVLASDRAPQDIVDVDTELIACLSGGLIVDVASPDYATRTAILQATCEERRLTISAGALDELAQVEFESVRELQGALNRLVSHQTGAHGQRAVAPPAPAQKPDGEFEDFLSEISVVVQEQVEAWEAAAHDPARTAESEALAARALSGDPMAEPPGAAPPRDASFLDREKVVWHWPDVGARVIEELR